MRPLAAAHTPLDIGFVLGSKPPIAPGEAEARARAPFLLPESLREFEGLETVSRRASPMAA